MNHGPRVTEHDSRNSIHDSAAFPSAEATRRVLAHLHLFVKKLNALLAELLAVTVLELANLAIEGRFIFHGGWPPEAA
jgi:hypothetical protein